MKKRTLSLLLALLMTVLFLALPVSADAVEGFAPDFELTANAVYLYNIDTGKVIYEKNAHEPLPPASMTKVMTAILAMEMTGNLDTEIVTYPMVIQNELYLYQQEHGRISNAGLLAGEELSMRDCLYALLLPSANEVALSIAFHLDGSQAAFAQRMNNRAKELGATNTNFVNPNGLYDPDHLTTAHDIAQMALHAMTLPGFMDIVNTTNYNPGETNLHSSLPWATTNQMLVDTSSHYYPAVSGIKTGTVPESGFCLVSTANKDGFTYLLVVMGCGNRDEEGNLDYSQNLHFVESAKLYDWVFDTFRVKTLIERNTPVGEAELRLSSNQDHVKLVAGERFTSLLPNEVTAASVTYVPHTQASFDAPVTKGQEVGEVALILNGEEIGRVPLLIGETVEAAPALVLLDQVLGITRSFWFKFGIIFFVLLLIFYIILMILRNRRRRRSAYRPKRRM